MLFECKKVSFGYENQQVIKDLSFQVQEGEYVCVVGENGSAAADKLTKRFPGNCLGGDFIRLSKYKKRPLFLFKRI